MDNEDTKLLNLPEENFKKYCELMNNFEFSNVLTRFGTLLEN